MLCLHSMSRVSVCSCLHVRRMAREMLGAELEEDILLGSYARIFRLQFLQAWDVERARSVMWLVGERRRERRIMVRISWGRVRRWGGIVGVFRMRLIER